MPTEPRTLTPVYDLDIPRSPWLSPHRPAWWGWVLTATALVSGFIGGLVVWIALPHPQPAAVPVAAQVQPLTIIAQGDGTPTATVYYADGTEQSIAATAFLRPWTTHQAVRVVVVVGATQCAIVSDGTLLAAKTATPAVCTWPPA